MGKYIKYPLMLFIIGGICAALVTSLYYYTRPVLQARFEKETTENLNKLYENVESFELTMNKSDINVEGIIGIFTIKLDSGEEIVVYQTNNKGKNGEVVMFIAFKESKIENVLIASSKETPGIGSKIEDEAYINNVKGKEISEVKIDTISGATYSSEAFKKSVEDASRHYEKEILK